MTIVGLRDARPGTTGGKAALLGTLIRSGLPVPDGFVVPTCAYRAHVAVLGGENFHPEQILAAQPPGDLIREIDQALRRLLGASDGDHVAVRSSATGEDGAGASAAGQHDSVLAARGTEPVCEAMLRCWASLWTPRAVAYRSHDRTHTAPAPEMAVLVQRFLDAEVSGVLFTGPERILEATRGLGEQLVSGQFTPDAWRIDDTGITARRPGGQTERSDRRADALIRQPVAPAQRRTACLSDAQVHAVDELGRRVTRVLGGPADIEWALTNRRLHVLQARPITAPVPQMQATARRRHPDHLALHGLPASAGIATGSVRVITGAADFRRVGPGDVLVCRHTDPAWTPLFQVAAAVVTEAGGVLCHAAIVAREVGIPAVLGVPEATRALPDGTTVTVDGAAGSVHLTEPD